MRYSEDQLLEAKKISFEEGVKHQKPSDDTLKLIESNKAYMRELIETHEVREIQNYNTLKLLFESHINETAELNKTLILLLNGSKFIKIIFTSLVAFIIGLGIIITAIIKTLEWLRKG